MSDRNGVENISHFGGVISDWSLQPGATVRPPSYFGLQKMIGLSGSAGEILGIYLGGPVYLLYHRFTERSQGYQFCILTDIVIDEIHGNIVRIFACTAEIGRHHVRVYPLPPPLSI